MVENDELWIPLVDEPIGSIVQQIVDENPEIARLVESPHRILAFRTFAYIRCGLLLGQLLFDHDVVVISAMLGREWRNVESVADLAGYPRVLAAQFAP
jgi:hypothetical protein